MTCIVWTHIVSGEIEAVEGYLAMNSEFGMDSGIGHTSGIADVTVVCADHARSLPAHDARTKGDV